MGVRSFARLRCAARCVSASLRVFIELERMGRVELGGVAEIVERAVVHAAQRLKAPPRSRSG